MSHYSFAVRKTINLQFLIRSLKKNEKPKGFVLQQNFCCVYQIQPHFKATLIVKTSMVCKLSLKNFKVVWFLITVSNSTWLYSRRWAYNKKIIKHWEFIWNAWNSFHLKSHCLFMFHLITDPELRSDSILTPSSGGSSQAPRVWILGIQLGGTRFSLPFKTRLLKKGVKMLYKYIQIYLDSTCTYICIYILHT